MKNKLIMITTALFLCLFVFFASNTLVFADEVSGETTTESIESSVPSESETSSKSETSTTTETSETESSSTAESSKETTAEESKESTTPSESTETSSDKIFNITEEDIDKIIDAAKQGNIDEVKNLLIGTIGFTAFTILMALIYLVKAKVKQASEAKLLESANEVTNDNIKELAKQLDIITASVNSKMDNVETSVKNYYQALNSEKVEEATKKAKEIAEALEVAMSLNKTSNEETQEEVNEEIETE